MLKMRSWFGPVGFAVLALLAGSAAVAQAPTEVRFAVIYASPIESPWNTAFIQSMERVKAAKPRGLTVSYDQTESVKPGDAERVLTGYAASGKYQIIWAHSIYSDAVAVLQKRFPDLMWVVTGGGNEALSGNGYYIDAVTHEPAFLMGAIAGMMTKSKVIGVIAGFPNQTENIPSNAFILGAKSVHPDLAARVTYIGSWFDPPKTKESARAQIAAGADMIFSTRFGAFEAAAEGNALVFGHMVDQHKVNPKVVVTSSMVRFDPSIVFAIDEWWAFRTQGKRYAAPKAQPIVYSMAQGGSDLAPFHAFQERLPKDVLARAEQMKADVLAGRLKIPVNAAPAK